MIRGKPGTVPYVAISDTSHHTKLKIVMETLPLHHFILVKLLESEQYPTSGISASDKVLGKLNQGEVVSASEGTKVQSGNLRPIEVKIGDCVLFGKYDSQPVRVDIEEFLIIREDKIIDVLKV